MSDTTLEKHLATVVMKSKIVSNEHGEWYEGLCGWVDGWHPLENIDQAMMCLDTIDTVTVESWFGLSGKRYHRVTVGLVSEGGAESNSTESLPRAICTAIGWATGWSE